MAGFGCGCRGLRDIRPMERVAGSGLGSTTEFCESVAGCRKDRQRTTQLSRAFWTVDCRWRWK
jgi:hypothetical protein